MAMGKTAAGWGRHAKSNLSPLDFLARSNSGFEGRPWGEIAFHGQAVAGQLGPGKGLEPAKVPVLRRVAGVGKELVVGQGVDRPTGQDFEHLRPSSGRASARRSVMCTPC